MSFGLMEILLVLAAVIVIFGSRRIPELARALGRAKHEYQKAKKALAEEMDNQAENKEKNTEEDTDE